MSVLIIVLVSIVVLLIIGYFWVKFAKSGFGKGKMEIVIGKTNYNSGETITGKIIITAKKNFVAKTLTADLTCKRQTTSNSNGKTSSSSDLVFKKTAEIAKNLSFLAGETKEFDFKIDIPDDAFIKTTTNKTLNMALGILTKQHNKLSWKLDGKAEISSLIKVSETKKIYVN